MRRLRLAAIAWVAACAALAASAGAEPAASRYLPLDHWAYDGIRLLRAAGYLDDLNPLVQPYRRADVAGALRDVDPARLPRGLDHWARLLRVELEREIEAGAKAAGDRTAPRWGGWLSGGGNASTSALLDPLRPAGDEDGWLFARGGVWLETGRAASELVVRTDQYLEDSPDGGDPHHRFARTETGYVEVGGGAVSVTAGRLARNWSRIGGTGLMLSGVAPTPPHLALEIRAGRFAVHSLVAELDTLVARKRYLSAHRVDLAWPNLVLTLGESVLLAQSGSGLPLRHLSPIEMFLFDTEAPPDDVVQNLMLQAGFWWRTGGVELYGDGLLDDVDIAPPEGADPEPATYAFTLGARRVMSGLVHAVGAEFTRVAAWTYRTPNEFDRYAYLGWGLGEAIADFDRLTLSADLFPPVPGLRLSPAVQLFRKGGGRFTDPVPPPDAFLAAPTMFLGGHDTVRRFALGGRWQPRGEVWATWDIGINATSYRSGGPNATEFEGTVGTGFRFDVLDQ